MPPRPGAGLVLVQSHVALLRLELRFNAPPGTAHAGQGLQGRVLGSVGQVVAGLAAVQVPAVDGPVDFARLPPAGWPRPLGAEPVAAGTLASLGHRYLPPGIPRQFIAALLHGPALTVSQPGLAGAPARTPDTPHWSRPAPAATPCRRLGRPARSASPAPPSRPGRTATCRRRRPQPPTWP